MSELAENLYVSEGDVRVVLDLLGEAAADDAGRVVSQDVCVEVSAVLDPWPFVRQVPDHYV